VIATIVTTLSLTVVGAMTVQEFVTLCTGFVAYIIGGHSVAFQLLPFDEQSKIRGAPSLLVAMLLACCGLTGIFSSGLETLKTHRFRPIVCTLFMLVYMLVVYPVAVYLTWRPHGPLVGSTLFGKDGLLLIDASGACTLHIASSAFTLLFCVLVAIPRPALVSITPTVAVFRMYVRYFMSHMLWMWVSISMALLDSVEDNQWGISVSSDARLDRALLNLIVAFALSVLYLFSLELVLKHSSESQQLAALKNVSEKQIVVMLEQNPFALLHVMLLASFRQSLFLKDPCIALLAALSSLAAGAPYMNPFPCCVVVVVALGCTHMVIDHVPYASERNLGRPLAHFVGGVVGLLGAGMLHRSRGVFFGYQSGLLLVTQLVACIGVVIVASVVALILAKSLWYLLGKKVTMSITHILDTSKLAELNSMSNRSSRTSSTASSTSSDSSHASASVQI
jgi:hypothetical protein